MKIHLKVWRQRNGESKGYLEDHTVEADEHMSFLEMMDVLNEDLVSKKETPVAFDSKSESLCLINSRCQHPRGHQIQPHRDPDSL